MSRLADADELVHARLTLRDTAVAATRKLAGQVMDAVAEVGALSEPAQIEYLAHRFRNHLEDEDVLPLVLDHAFAGFSDILRGARSDRGPARGHPDDPRDVTIRFSEWASELGDTNALVITP